MINKADKELPSNLWIEGSFSFLIAFINIEPQLFNNQEQIPDRKTKPIPARMDRLLVNSHINPAKILKLKAQNLGYLSFITSKPFHANDF